MRAAIHTPYLATLGGGERYIVGIARVLLSLGWSVYLESKAKNIVSKLEKRFGVDLQGLKTTDSIKRGDGYDLCFWLSDGSIPVLLARKNILHFQRPFFEVDGKSLINRMKFFRINKVVVNSRFTKKWIDKEYPIESVVIYPPVDIEKFRAGKKENLILSVARFSQLEQSKRQDVLVEAFKRLYDSGYRKWRLVLAGGSEVGGAEFAARIKKSSVGYPITVIENPSFEKVKELYSKAKLFWSASGFEIDEEKEPQKVEHFGINIVEAMAASAPPLAYNAGGHREIIKSGQNGFLWNNKDELLRHSEDLIEDTKLLKKISLNAKKDSALYSYERFKKEFSKLI